MDAVVLAGGLGTRLRSVIHDLPKPMAPVAGRPFLEILLTTLAAKGVDHVVLSVGYRAQDIIDHFGHAFGGITISYAIESEPLGTGGALKLALKQCRQDPVLVLNGDTFLDFDLPGLLALWSASEAPIVVVGRHVDDTGRFGRLGLVGDRITEFAEKGRSGPGLINAGAYLVLRDLLDRFEESARFSLESDFFVPEVRQRKIRVMPCDAMFIDIGVPEDYALAQVQLARFAAKP